ncbi:tetratricopeptide repeat protein [Dactylosporangium sp. CS-047395]|uniref:tetratricopeptide repeat protein n=1 Tax=Dactylosporangium sp. CS-047395 TaxID=3239936 RepID=UPI003D94D71B
MRWSRPRVSWIAVVAVLAVVVALLLWEGLDRADKWASVAGGGAAVAGLVIAELRRRRPARRSGSGATFTGAPLTVPAGGGTALLRGRDQHVRRLRRAARRPDGRLYVLTGLGGVGKSCLAVSTCRWFERRHGERAWWITAEEGLTEGLVSVAEDLRLGRAHVTAIRAGSPRAVEQLWEALSRTRRRWLLVFDNVDDTQVAAGLVGSAVARCADRGLVLVTSRLAGTSRIGGRPLWDGAETVELGPLGGPDAAQVLLDLAPGGGDRPAAERLAADLGGLPLALHLAGSYLGSPFPIWRTFDDYRAALRELGVRTVLGPADESIGHRGNVALTWELSLSALDRQGLPQCRALLRVLAYFAPAVPVPEKVLQSEETLEARRLVQRGLEGLADHGLIDRLDATAPDGGRLLMLHPLVADVSRQGAAAAGDAVDLLVAAVAARRFDDNAEWRWFGLFAPHVEQLLKFSGTLGEEHLAKLVATVARVVAASTWRGHEAAAESLAGSALRHASGLGSDHAAMLALRNEWAWAVGRQGRWKRAHSELTEVCAARTRLLGAGHRDTLDTRHKLAWATGRLGDWEAARDLLEPVLVARSALLGADDPDTLHTRCCLAWAIGRCGREEEARQRYAEVIADRRRVLGADHVETLDARHSLAELFVLSSLFGAAERELRPLIADRLRVLGAEHPETLDTRPRYWLGVALLEQGRRREGRRVLRRLADDQTRHLGPGHAATTATLERLNT